MKNKTLTSRVNYYKKTSCLPCYRCGEDQARIEGGEDSFYSDIKCLACGYIMALKDYRAEMLKKNINLTSEVLHSLPTK